MSIFGADYEFVDLLEIMEDLDKNENRIRDLRNPRDAYDAVNKRYMNKRIEYKTKELEKKNLLQFKLTYSNNLMTPNPLPRIWTWATTE